MHSKLEGKVQRFPIYYLPPQVHSLPVISIPHQSGIFDTTDEPFLTHHYHPESTAYIRVPSSCCSFCGFAQMCNVMSYSASGSIASLGQKCCVPPSHPSCSPAPSNHNLFTICIVLPFSERHIVGIIQ